MRVLGFGARIFSGHLQNSDQLSVGSANAETTHAWAEVHFSGAGWVTFDPTHRSIGGLNLIPVAVVRNILLVVVVSGSFVGMTNALKGMLVEVTVTS